LKSSIFFAFILCIWLLNFCTLFFLLFFLELTSICCIQIIIIVVNHKIAPFFVTKFGRASISLLVTEFTLVCFFIHVYIMKHEATQRDDTETDKTIPKRQIRFKRPSANIATYSIMLTVVVCVCTNDVRVFSHKMLSPDFCQNWVWLIAVQNTKKLAQGNFCVR